MAMLEVIALEITACSLMQGQTLIVTVSTPTCQQYDVSVTVEDIFSYYVSARHDTKHSQACFFSLLLNFSDSGVVNLGFTDGQRGLSVYVYVYFLEGDS